MFKFEFGNFNMEKLRFTPDEIKFVAEKGEAIVFDNLLCQAIQIKHPQGIDGRSQRTLMRILDKLDKAGHNPFIEVENDERELIFDCFNDDVRFPAAQTRMISHIRIAVAKITPIELVRTANDNGC